MLSKPKNFKNSSVVPYKIGLPGTSSLPHSFIMFFLTGIYSSIAFHSSYFVYSNSGNRLFICYD